MFRIHINITQHLKRSPVTNRQRTTSHKKNERSCKRRSKVFFSVSLFSLVNRQKSLVSQRCVMSSSKASLCWVGNNNTAARV